MSFNIDSTSYTNKDFREVFAELLQLVPELTNKWDPNASNESDPGVVLLKLAAFVADKLNYNIDKNVLENFPSSVTQRGNAQKLYHLLGYELEYYKSATVPVTFRYNKNGNDYGLIGVNNATKYTIPKFTELRDDNSSITYTLLNDVQVPLSEEYATETTGKGTAIEGPVYTFTINGVDLITVDNLDSDNRIYFTESMIPSNGVFIYNDNDNDLWTAVNNLQATPLGSKVYKFGVMPQSNTVYIEFPQDASRVFGSGVHIKYVVTSGTSGNIPAYTLTQLNSEIRVKTVMPDDGESQSPEDGIDVSLYTVLNNPSSSTNGADCESLSDAYKHFKKAVNTFETLVTCQDYVNAVQQSGVVSNGTVSDRTNDLNNAYTVRTQAIDGEDVVVLNYGDVTGNTLPPTKTMDTFELSLYALNLQDSVVDAKTYNNTFKTSAEAETVVKEALKNCKSLQHDWKSIDYNDANKPFLFNNLYEVSGKILTYQKVTSAEALEIENNVQLALFDAYNAKEVEFGSEIQLEDLLDTIRNADKRIREVFLNTPELTLNKVVAKNSSLVPMTFKGDNGVVDKQIIDIVAKSILAGISPYCKWNTTTKPQYYMQPLATEVGAGTADKPLNDESGNIIADNVTESSKSTSSVESPIVNNVKNITTQATIDLKATKPYVIGENEVIQLYAPNYISIANISTYMYVAVKLAARQGVTRPAIEADELYKLGSGEVLCITENRNDLIELMKDLSYTPNKGYKIYNSGEIIKPSVELKNYVASDSDDNGIVWLETTKCVDVMSPNSVVINEKKDVYAAWIVNNTDNDLFEGKDERILGNDEVFIYTDVNKESLVILQSGTKLSYKGSKRTDWKCPKASLTDVQSNGLNSSIDWTKLEKETDGLETTEMQIITLGPDAEITSSKALTVINTPTSIESKQITYKTYKDSSEICRLSKLPSDSDGWKIFSRLQFLSSPDNVYTLKNGGTGSTGESSSKQFLQLYSSDTVDGEGKMVPVTLVSGMSVTTNILTVLSGGIKQDTSALNTDQTLSVTMFKYDETIQPIKHITEVNRKFTSAITDEYNYYKMLASDLTVSESDGGGGTVTSSKVRLRISNAFKNAVIPVKFISKTSDDSAVTVKYGSTTADSQLVIFSVKPEKVQYTLPCDGTIYYLQLTDNYSSNGYITFEFTNSEKIEYVEIYMYPPKKIEGYSTAVTSYVLDADKTKTNSFEKYAVLRRIAELSYINTVNSTTSPKYVSLFDYTYQPQDPIENPLQPKSFFNASHIYNRYTLARLDTDKLDIKVADQSRVQ